MPSIGLNKIHNIDPLPKLIKMRYYVKPKFFIFRWLVSLNIDVLIIVIDNRFETKHKSIRL